MNLNLKKMLPLAAASLLSTTSFLQADACNPCCPEVRPAGECKAPFVPATNPCTLGVINPNARPHINCARVTFSAELLYWNAFEDGLEYAISNTESPNLTNSGVSSLNSTGYYNAEVLNPEKKWDYGFRFGLGYVLTHDGWDIEALWTHFRRNATEEVTADSNTTTARIYTLYSAFTAQTGDIINGIPPGSQFLNPIAAEVHTSWRLHLDYIDLELGRSFYTSRYLTLRPHIGLRGANITQKYEITYLGGSFRQGTTSVPLNLTDEVEMENEFRGIGVRGGLNSVWRWSCGCGGDWSFYGNLALSLVYGHFDIEQEESIDDVANNLVVLGQTITSTGSVNVLDVENHFRATRALTDLAIGLRYDYDCCDADYHLALWLGWEHHIAFSMNQWVRYTSWDSATGHANPASPGTYTNYAPENGDLTTQGWVFGFALDF